MKHNNIIAIVGPTAVGKTEVAIYLADALDGEIVSADSMAVYKYMDIGTAKPDALEQQRAKFHLIDVADPRENFNVGEFQNLAHAAIDDIVARKKTAIIVGGSGLYVKAAIDGLDSTIPESDPAIRSELEADAEKHGSAAIYERLKSLDAEAAEKIHPSNVKRVVRAIEICMLSGRKFSEIAQESAEREPKYPETTQIGLNMKRDALYARIEQRVDKMIERGLVDEVRLLIDKNVPRESTAMAGLGYKEIADSLAGNYSIEEAVELIKKNTRRFAKRQLTWFNADKRIHWIDVDGLTAAEVSLIAKETAINDKE